MYVVCWLAIVFIMAMFLSVGVSIMLASIALAIIYVRIIDLSCRGE